MVRIVLIFLFFLSYDLLTELANCEKLAALNRKMFLVSADTALSVPSLFPERW